MFAARACVPRGKGRDIVKFSKRSIFTQYQNAHYNRNSIRSANRVVFSPILINKLFFRTTSFFADETPKVQSEETKPTSEEAGKEESEQSKLTGTRLHAKLAKTLRESEELIKGGKLKESLIKLNQIIQMKPNFSPKVYIYKVVVLSSAKQYERATKTADFALKLFPDNVSLTQSLARVKFESGQVAEAEIMYDNLLEKNPNDALSNNMKGKCAFLRREFDEANKYFDLALNLMPSVPRHHSDKGDVLCKKGQFEEALPYFDKAISLDDKNYTFPFKKSAALSYLKRFEEALECVNISIELYAGSKWSYNLKGNILHHLKKYDELLNMATIPIRLFKDSYIGYYHKGIALYFMERYDLALPRLKKALTCSDLDTVTANIINQIISACESRLEIRAKINEDRKKRNERKEKGDQTANNTEGNPPKEESNESKESSNTTEANAKKEDESKEAESEKKSE